MSDELDRRAAHLMGWTWNGVWSPSTDRNDLAELLREVERRGVVATYNMSTRIRNLWSADESVLANQYFCALTADPAIVCEAACEVLEAAK